MMSSLAGALPNEINRVRGIQDTYKELRTVPNVLVEPQIEMMEVAIKAGISACASGNVVAMMLAYEELKGWEQ